MPEQGDQLAPALQEAGRLLETEAAQHGQVVVLSDGFADPAESLRAAQELRQKGMTVHVIGVGTQAGAPEPDGKGGFVQDPNGRPRLTREQTDELQRVAMAGGGEFVTADAAQSLLPALRSDETQGRQERTVGTSADLAAWRNEGIWLLPPLLLLAGLLARRGWV